MKYGDWIAWNGGETPECCEGMQVITKAGQQTIKMSKYINWNLVCDAPIVAYRLPVVPLVVEHSGAVKLYLSPNGTVSTAPPKGGAWVYHELFVTCVSTDGDRVWSIEKEGI